MTTYVRTCLHAQEREHIVRSRHTVVGIETRLRAGQPRYTFSIPCQVHEVCRYPKACRPTLGSTQPTVQWVPRFSSGSRAAGACTDHSPLYGAEIKNTWTHTSTSPYFLVVYTWANLPHFLSLSWNPLKWQKYSNVFYFYLPTDFVRTVFYSESRRNTCRSSCNVVVIFVEC
jgi:hypothetical protein